MWLSLFNSYDIMSQCWCENPAHRPTFSAIREQLDELLSHHRNYLDLDNLGPCPLPPSNGRIPETAILDSDDDDDELSYAATGLLPPGGMRPFGATIASSSACADGYQRVRSTVNGGQRCVASDDVHYLKASDVVVTSPDYERPSV
jgi:hypothetical protein